MYTKKIAFFDAKPYDRRMFDAAIGEVDRNVGLEIIYFEAHLTDNTARLAEGCDTVCAFVNDTIDNRVIDRLAQLGIKLIVLRSAGYNNVDLKSAYGRIHVMRVPAYSPYAVAEHTVALILSLNRKIHRAYYRTRDNNFAIDGLMGFDLHGKTAGVIGTGKIGKTVIGILNGFGMRILAFDPYHDEVAAEELGFDYAELESIYAEADVITLHCPLTPETHHLINEASIEMMKPGVMIINTGRGHLIDTKALIEGLRSEKVGLAGLDVYEEESDIFFEDLSSQTLTDDVLARLLNFNNVLVTSHQAFFTREALSNIAHTTLDNVTAFLEGGPLENEICYRCDSEACAKKEAGCCFLPR